MPQRRARSQNHIEVSRSFNRTFERRHQIADAFADLGTVVYFIRVDGLIKIGYSGDLRMRRRKLTSDLTAILAVMPGGTELEAQMHERFAASLAKGKEWFHPTPDLIAYVNEVRERMSVPPVQWPSDPVAAE